MVTIWSFDLVAEEYNTLRSQIMTSKEGKKGGGDVTNFETLVFTSQAGYGLLTKKSAQYESSA